MACFLLTSAAGPGCAAPQAFSVDTLPLPGAMVDRSDPFLPVLPKGMALHPDKPLNVDLLIDSGHDDADPAFIREQSERMMKYFLAAITVPGRDLWVNLSPYEHERMITEELGRTLLGRDMLAQDYVLKQLTASFIYPEQDLGREFWARVYEAAEERFGDVEIPVSTFNKVWIMPDTAEIFEKGNAVYVTRARLKVMLEADYLAASSSAPMGAEDPRVDTRSTPALDMTKDVIREVILPAIEQEVNEGRNFAVMRQIYHVAILAKWYRERVQDTLLSRVFIDRKKTAGVEVDDQAVKEQIYQRYVAAYKKGVFDYIKEEPSSVTGEMLPHKYFSGGETMDPAVIELTHARAATPAGGKLYLIDLDMAPRHDMARAHDQAMSAEAWKNAVEKFNAILDYVRSHGVDFDAISKRYSGRKVIINEVTFRDGIQGEQEANFEKMTPQQKIDGIQKLIDAGVMRIEAGSYPSPKLLEKGILPGVRNTAEVADLVREKRKDWPGVEFGYLVLDKEGDISAVAHDPEVDEISFNIPASVKYSQTNLGMRTGIPEVDEKGAPAIYEHVMGLPEEEQYDKVMQKFRSDNVPSIQRLIRHALMRESKKPLRLRMYLSNAFGYTVKGKLEEMDPGRLVKMMEEMTRTIDRELAAIAAELGVPDPRALVSLEFAISDTSGEVTDPAREDGLRKAEAVFTRIKEFKKKAPMPVSLALHLQARGMGLLTAAMYLDAMDELGESPILDVSLGYTGGSPFSADAPGNLGLGDLLVWFKALKIKTLGKDGDELSLKRTLDVSRWLQTFFKDDFMTRGAAGFNHMTEEQITAFTKNLRKEMGIKDDAEQAPETVDQAALTPGGIDIKDIDLASTSSGRGVYLDERAVVEVYRAGFDGFQPVSVSMAPVSDPAALFQ